VTKSATPVPPRFHTVTPYLIAKGAAQAIEFYKKAFGAEEIYRMPAPDGKTVMHAEIKIGDSIVMLADEFPQMNCLSPLSRGGTTVSLHLYFSDVDAAFKRATHAGAQVKMPPTNMFWGDRMAKIADPFGHEWSLATHVEDLTAEEVARRGLEAMSKMPTKEIP